MIVKLVVDCWYCVCCRQWCDVVLVQLYGLVGFDCGEVQEGLFGGWDDVEVGLDMLVEDVFVDDFYGCGCCVYGQWCVVYVVYVVDYQWQVGNVIQVCMGDEDVIDLCQLCQWQVVYVSIGVD